MKKNLLQCAKVRSFLWSIVDCIGCNALTDTSTKHTRARARATFYVLLDFFHSIRVEFLKLVFAF